jgi:hypothetical protein
VGYRRVLLQGWSAVWDGEEKPRRRVVVARNGKGGTVGGGRVFDWEGPRRGRRTGKGERGWPGRLGLFESSR